MPEALPVARTAARDRRGGITLVTGASGFLGRHVCAYLVGSGVRTRALMRRPDPDLVGVQAVRTPDILERAALRRALEGVDTVLHLAGRAHQQARGADAAAELRRVNAGGTSALLEEAARAGVRTFVLASSMKAVGESTPGDMRWDETVTPAPRDAYGASKLEAEWLVHGAAERHGFRAVVLRLPLVYGAGMRANMLRLFALVDRGIPLPFGGIDNRRSLIYAGNVAVAIDALLDGPAGCEVFFASDGRDLSTPELISTIGRVLGRHARLVRVPRALLAAAARAGDGLGRFLPVPFDTPALERLHASLAVDITKLLRAGYAPAFTVEQGMAETAAWYRSRG